LYSMQLRQAYHAAQKFWRCWLLSIWPLTTLRSPISAIVTCTSFSPAFSEA
jgi:hypothetical protein